MKKIAVVGYKGKMGSLIYQALRPKFEVVGVDKDNSLFDYSNLDLVIDFASAESSVNSARFCLKYNIPLIIGATGQSDVQNQEIEEISKQIAVYKSPNFSSGIEAILNLSKSMLELNPSKVEIVEKHHIHKKDSPSGTAIYLYDELKRIYQGEIEITSIREGEEVGQHSIIFWFDNEKLTLTHNAFSRYAFVNGVTKLINNLLN